VSTSAFAKRLVEAHQATAALGDRLAPQLLTLGMSSSQSFDSPFREKPSSDSFPQTIPFTADTDIAPQPPRRWLLPVAGGAVGLLLLGGIGYVAWPPRAEPAPSAPKEVTQASTSPAPTGEPEIPDGMVLIPAGSFTMGTDTPTPSQIANPPHTVEVDAFLLDKYEVTNGQYAEFVAATGYHAPSSWPNGKMPPEDTSRPVVNVSWDDAKAYAAWAGKRLPTEKEWEYAARGQDSYQYPWGNEWSPRAVSSGRSKPAPVGTYADGNSPFGISDMASNVSEWVEDTLDPYPGSAFKENKEYRVFRGGNFTTASEEAQLTWMRFADGPEKSFKYVGFRCAKNYP
jgi:formylglycine-generating enzyme required for sulfatase activity